MQTATLITIEQFFNVQLQKPTIHSRTEQNLQYMSSQGKFYWHLEKCCFVFIINETEYFAIPLQEVKIKTPREFQLTYQLQINNALLKISQADTEPPLSSATEMPLQDVLFQAFDELIGIPGEIVTKLLDLDFQYSPTENKFSLERAGHSVSYQLSVLKNPQRKDCILNHIKGLECEIEVIEYLESIPEHVRNELKLITISQYLIEKQYTLPPEIQQNIFALNRLRYLYSAQYQKLVKLDEHNQEVISELDTTVIIDLNLLKNLT